MTKFNYLPLAAVAGINDQTRVTLESLDDNRVILDETFPNVGGGFTAMALAAAYVPEMRDCGFLCVDNEGHDHCRMFAGQYVKTGEQVTVVFCADCAR